MRLLTEVTEGDVSPVTRLLEEALARGLAAKEALRERAGGFKSTAWASDHLKISRRAVDKRRKAGKLLAFETADRTYEYPLCQFGSEGVVTGLEEALAAMPVENPWERLSLLVTPSPALAGRPVIEVLRDTGNAEERELALAVVRNFLR